MPFASVVLLLDLLATHEYRILTASYTESIIIETFKYTSCSVIIHNPIIAILPEYLAR
jgi:hypothetical protein